MEKNIFLAFGANLGEPAQTFSAVLADLKNHPRLRVEQVSSLYQTAPVGVTSQPNFLNAAIQVATNFSAEELLDFLFTLEKKYGRTRTEKWSPRTCDLDLLFYSDLILQKKTCTVPHPRLHERRFVLIPLAEIAPEFVHPVLQKTVAELLRERGDKNIVVKI